MARPDGSLPRSGVSCRSQEITEERNLTTGPVPVRRRSGRQRFVDAREQFRAFASEEIKCPRFYQALQHLAIRDARIEPPAKILERIELACVLTLANGRFHRPLPHILDRREPVANCVS